MEKIYDVIVIGGGPSGLSAGIYAGRAKLDTLLIEKEKEGGQIRITSELVNYPGILETSGADFGVTARKQAENFGVTFLKDEVIDMDFSQKIKTIKTKTGEFKALSVVIATGASPRKLGFPREQEYTGRGVAYCATCDGEFFTGMDIFVIGAGFAAAEEAMFLTKYGKSVTVIAREPEFTCAKTIADKVLAHPKITVKFNTELTELGGDMKPRWAKFKNNQTGEVTEYKAPEGDTFGVFIFVGYAPQSALFKNHIEVNEQGFIPTNEDLMTNVEGVFAAGDIRPKRLRQVVTAVADGAIASTSIEKYIHDLREELGLKKEEKEAEHTTPVHDAGHAFLDDGLKQQLADVVARFENPIELVVIKDPNNAESEEMENAVSEIVSVSDKIKCRAINVGEDKDLEAKVKAERFPTIVILDKDGAYSNLKYSSIPGGHELNSFILGMYNVAGPGQKLSEETLAEIAKIDKPMNIKIGISLNCTKCPKTVQSAQRIATLNKNVEMEMVNIFSFKDFKDKYDIMSVPAVVINNEHLYFGEKNIEDMLAAINKSK